MPNLLTILGDRRRRDTIHSSPRRTANTSNKRQRSPEVSALIKAVTGSRTSSPIKMILPSSPSELDSDAAVSSAVAASKSSPDALYELSDAGSHSLSSDATAGSSLSVLRSVPSPHLLLLI
ncbi:hypothetical protein F441_08592 [Phytophthora nicotianae CJ01A1]|nr:hypothetical protein F443_08616 [Phytophthora nicotianae P1569]ETL93596.1 hypothetical protein L917_08272 [Phytophthora nicotianae]ETP16889.1 hypothetical protein F441_08592 [Phytophthora nicotianae CJ01A1]